MATVKSSAENLTLNADGSGNDILFQSNGTQVGSLTAEGVFTATSFAGSGAALTGLSSFDPDGAVVFNESGADVDFRVESDTDTNALFVQGSDGNVGIGTGSPQNLLHLQAADSANDNYRTGADTPLIVEGTTSAYIQIVADANAPMGVVMADASDSAVGGIIYDADAYGMRIKCGGSTRMEVAVAGDVKVNSGDLIFGTSGKGVVLGATSNTDANTLEDYEEGTYTPEFLDSSGAAMTGTLSNAVYTKIGRLVHIMVYYTVGDCQNGALNTMSLPFTQIGGRGAGSIVTYNCPAANVENACYINSGSKVAFWNIRNDATSLTMTVDNGSELIIAATYMANV